MSYRCPVCKTKDEAAYMLCNHPVCPDGRDPRPSLDGRLAAKEAECEALRKIISECATACGAFIDPTASVEFMAMLPREISMGKEAAEARVKQVRAETIEECLRVAADEVRSCIEASDAAKARGDLDEMYKRNTAFHSASCIAAGLLALASEESSNAG